MVARAFSSCLRWLREGRAGSQGSSEDMYGQGYKKAKWKPRLTIDASCVSSFSHSSQTHESGESGLKVAPHVPKVATQNWNDGFIHTPRSPA